MLPLGFDHCVIAVSDWAAADTFYREVLGAEIPPHDQWWGEYRFAAHGVPIEAGPFERDSGPRGRAIHLYFRDPDGSLLEFVSYGETEDGVSSQDL